MIFARFRDKCKQDGKIWLKSCFRGGGGGGGGGGTISEIKCIIFKENDDNPYEINNNDI
jgi:hypothetical protein